MPTRGAVRGTTLTIVFACLVSFGQASRAYSEQELFERVSLDASAEKDRVADGGFEGGHAPVLDNWFFWEKGYEIAPRQGRDGSRAIKCSLDKDDTQMGAAQRIALNQERPRPIVAIGWSRAENVNNVPTPGYSVYLDIEYDDGTSLWGQTANFSTGTHDWEERRCLVLPSKPIKTLTIYALFRGHTGTVYFDDFALKEFESEDVYFFEGVPVKERTMASRSEQTGQMEPGGWLGTSSGLGFGPGSRTTRFALGDSALFSGGAAFFVRDAASDSGFLAPDDTGSGGLPTLGLRLNTQVATRGDHLEIMGKVTDLRGEDRAVTVYFALPVAGDGWVWSDGPRQERPATKGVYTNCRGTGAGSTGQRSLYPLAALSGPDGGVAMAVPMSEPRHHRFGYDATAGLFYAAFDFGLSPDTAAFPSSADFRLLVYSFDPKWRFRAALSRYYDLFPESFVKRVDREGLWMAFTDISTVEGWQDFGFAFHEGTNNIEWDEQNDILSFVYTEPMTTWLPMPPEVPRTHDDALGYMRSLLDSPDAAQRETASKTELSLLHDIDGKPILHVNNAPWCDGAVFGLNANPALATTPEHAVNQGTYALRGVEGAFPESGGKRAAGWIRYGAGYELDADVFDEGERSMRVATTQPGGSAGAMQSVTLNQERATPLILRARVRAQDVGGTNDNDFSVYVDLTHTDGTPMYGRTIPADTGTHGFMTLERTIESDKPFRDARVYLLMRGEHSGSAWFDDVFLGETGSDVNLLTNPGMEGTMEEPAQVDGTYIDSFCYFDKLINGRREHFASARIPLVFDRRTCQVGILNVFSTFEFERELARRMREKGKLMMANAALLGYAFPAHYLDVLGTETNWFPGGAWLPTSDEDLIFQRAICRGKPYCFLMNTHFEALTLDLIERYMQRALFYGMFPGFFSENASTDCYFHNPEWYNASRPLFKKYVPLVKLVAAAGWQPITNASASDERVYVERYGDPASGPVFIASLNETSEQADAEMSIDMRALGLGLENAALADMLTGESVAFRTENGAILYKQTLPAHGVGLVRVSLPEHETL